MHWVYVLRCSDDGHIYVGETTRLYRRFYEHQYNNGSVNTSNHPPDELIGLYSVTNNYCFAVIHQYSKYNPMIISKWSQRDDTPGHLDVENHITERFMIEFSQDMVRGGKYTKNEICDSFDSSLHKIDRPLCHCGFPCEVKLKNDKTKIYFVCPIPTWDDFYDGLHLPNTCNFWEEYKTYRIIKEKFMSRINDMWWVRRMERNEENYSCTYHCKLCNLGEGEYKKALWYKGINYTICEDCFYQHYDDLKHKYTKEYTNKTQITTISE